MPETNEWPIIKPLPPEILGIEVVGYEDLAVEGILKADFYGNQIEKADELERKIHPTDGKLAYFLGRLSGRSITRRERAWLRQQPPGEELAQNSDNFIRQHNTNYWLKQKGLEQVRGKLKDLSDSEKGLIEHNLRISASPYLSSLYQALVNENPAAAESSPAELDDISWAGWLGKKASSEQLTNFLQWHAHSVNQQIYSSESKVEIESQRVFYKQAVLKGIDEGWLSPRAAAAAQKVDSINVYVGDLFDTLAKDWGGYCPSDGDYVVIAQGVGADSERRQISLFGHIRHALVHEFNHAELGKFTERWLDEATAEHVALSLQFGQPEIIKPDLRTVDKRVGVYNELRELLHVLINNGTEQVEASKVTRAYSENQKPWIGSEERAELEGSLDESWRQMGTLALVSDYLLELKNQLIISGMPEIKAQNLAACYTRKTISLRPELIFGRGYKLSQDLAEAS